MNAPSSSPQPPLTSVPREIHCAQEYESLAQRFMAHASYEYVAGGSGHGVTTAANLGAFAQWSVYPRVLRAKPTGHTRVMVGHEEFAHPIFLGPVAFQKLAHPLGELETARAAQAMQSCLVSSTLSTTRLEDIALAAGPQRWFQLYFQPRRETTLDLVRRAEAAGYGAIVVTLDATVQAASLRALRAGFRMPADCIAANLIDYAPPARIKLENEESRVFQGLLRDAPTWQDIDWLLTQTKLPLWIKGVLHPDDASDLQMRGVAGLVISNHGGRGLDGAPGSLQILPAIRDAVDSLPLILDGGIRSGSDIFKALALGADAVMIGRLQMYALSVAGALGVAHMIKLLREELEVCMALAGCTTVADINRAALLSVRQI